MVTLYVLPLIHFNPRPSREGRQYIGNSFAHKLSISIHAPRGRGDKAARSLTRPCSNFNPRPSREGRPLTSGRELPTSLFQSTPLAGGATASDGVYNHIAPQISIHAPRGRGDRRCSLAERERPISIHAPRGRGDKQPGSSPQIFIISIHAPRGRGDAAISIDTDTGEISIHAPRGRGDYASFPVVYPRAHFNPRPSREGRRSHTVVLFRLRRYFNPRPSREGRRLYSSTRVLLHADFNPRPSREGRHRDQASDRFYPVISIHAPRGRGDPGELAANYEVDPISIHAPRGRGDLDTTRPQIADIVFQSTPLAGGATSIVYKKTTPRKFQSTPLAGGATGSLIAALLVC